LGGGKVEQSLLILGNNEPRTVCDHGIYIEKISGAVSQFNYVTF